MFEVILFAAGVFVGHYISPWIDGKIADFQKDTDQ